MTLTECPLVVVTGPTSLVKSPSSLSSTPLSDTERRPRLSDQGERSEPHPAPDEQSEPGALSDGELDRRAAANHRLLRPSRFTTRRKVRHHLHDPPALYGNTEVRVFKEFKCQRLVSGCRQWKWR